VNPTTRLLMDVRALLNEPARWTKGASARDAAGLDVEPFDPNATCWCISGAMVAAANRLIAPGSMVDGYDLHEHPNAAAFFRQAQEIVRRVVGGIPAFNDAANTKHADVVQAMTFAVEIALEEL